LNLKIRCPISLNKQDEFDHFKSLKPDLVVVVAYGKIIPANFLNIKKILFINLHASLLPRWRGAAPIQRSIINMDEETGVSIMKIVDKLDAGPILLTSKIKITKDSKFNEISQKMSNIGAKLILEAINLIKNNTVNFIDQNENEATYAKKIEKKEARINWNDSAQIVHQKIRAFNPSPGAFSLVKNSKKRIKILKADIIKKSFIKDYKNLDIGHCSEELIVRCGDGFIKVLEIQPEGKAKLKSSEFLNGYNFKNLIFE
jgi:methionyl-tRNA formyltransferase